MTLDERTVLWADMARPASVTAGGSVILLVSAGQEGVHLFKDGCLADARHQKFREVHKLVK